MTEPLARPRRKNPLRKTRTPLLPPGARSRTALGLTAAAAEGRFQLQVCEACPWLFLDLSRNHSRRWCSMNVCGGTMKMRRYRARARRRSGTGSSA